MRCAANALAVSQFAPHNRKSDLNEPRFDGERVHLIPEIREALDAFIAGGFMAMTPASAQGGLQLQAGAFGNAGDATVTPSAPAASVTPTSARSS